MLFQLTLNRKAPAHVENWICVSAEAANWSIFRCKNSLVSNSNYNVHRWASYFHWHHDVENQIGEKESRWRGPKKEDQKLSYVARVESHIDLYSGHCERLSLRVVAQCCLIFVGRGHTWDPVILLFTAFLQQVFHCFWNRFSTSFELTSETHSCLSCEFFDEMHLDTGSLGTSCSIGQVLWDLSSSRASNY